MPLFSVITTCRNAGGSIAKTILSVLEQDFRDFEYIIMDGCSSDDTCKVADSYKDAFAHAGIPYMIFSEEDHGIYEGMNHALKHASGDYVNFMNADDCFMGPHTLTDAARAVKEALSDGKGKPGVFYGDSVAVEFNQTYRYTKDISLIESRMPFSHQSVFASRELLNEYPFNESYKIGADYDFLLNAYKNGHRFYDLSIQVCKVTLDGLSSVDLYNTFIETTRIQEDHGIHHYSDRQYAKKLRSLRLKQFVMDHFPKVVIMLIRKLQRIHRGQNEHC
ncbi:MAG: glycosyltransferase [Lachnospiraceae bacterium]|nr:glycosyltransferase [Lachnospiraceae bacterium]